MSDEATPLEEFLTNATDVLGETRHNLEELARLALLKYEQTLSGQENGHGITEVDPNPLRLQHISQQLLKLSEQSKALQTYLQNGLDTSLPDDEHWSRVRILQSQEEERAQLAHELEDGVGQLLANAVFELASCRHLLSSGQDVTDGLDALQTELEQGLTDIRHFITNLEPASILGSFGLGGGIRRYLEQYEARTGLKTQLRINTNIGRLPSIIEMAIFRIIQETLSNVRSHANATQVDVIIEEKDTALQFSVIDNGDGLISGKIGVSRKNLGLARMVDYAELLNGDLRILSEPGHGTQVILSVPYSVL
jgi:two-component system sensor histidine kinase DegS